MPSGGGGGGGGGAATSAAKLQAAESVAAAKTAFEHQEKAGSILYPGDLLPLTRKPLCLIVDSDSSAGFAQVVSPFGTPVIALLSPEETPEQLAAELEHSGSLFSFFLHAPLEAFAYVTKYDQEAVDATPKVAPVLKVNWRDCEKHLGKLYAKIRLLINDSGNLIYRCGCSVHARYPPPSTVEVDPR